MRTVRALCLAIGDATRASSRLRVHSWAPLLEKAGIECRILSYYRAGGTGKLTALPGMAGTLFRRWHVLTAVLREFTRSIDWADVILVQEVLLPLPVLSRIRSRKRRFLFDFSDPIHLAEGPQHGRLHRFSHRLLGLPSFRKSLQISDAVMVENDLFVPLVREHRTQAFVVRGPVDTDLYRPNLTSNRKEQVVIGWTGSEGTYSFLQPVLPVLQDLARQHSNLCLRLVGTRRVPEVPGVQVEAIPWDPVTEPSHVSRFDIGLASLPDAEWYRYRGGAKLLLYMAAGVPIVSSPLGIGDQVIRHEKNGFLARSPQEWYDAINCLAGDPTLRSRIAATVRQEAVTRYSYEAYAPLLTALLRGQDPPDGFEQ